MQGEQVAADLVKTLADRVLGIDSETRNLDKTTATLFRSHPYAHILKSMPGIGPGLGAEFLVAVGGTVDGFATAGHLASYAGLVPVPRDSGRITGNLRRPKRYNRSLRRVFYLAAQSSLSADGPSRVFYQRKRQQNRVHTQALLAVARKHVDVLWALLRDNREYVIDAPSELVAA